MQPSGRELLVGAIIVTAAATVLGRTLIAAATIEETAPAVRTAPAARGTESSTTSQSKQSRDVEPMRTSTPPIVQVEAADIELAVNSDPFHPERRAPDQAYRLPGDVIEVTSEQAPPPPPPPPPFRVVGTIATANGGIAALQLQDGSSRVIGVGESLGGFTLQRVSQLSALVEADGRSYTLQVEAPQRPRAQNGRTTQQRNTRESPAERRAAEMRETVERLRRDGAPPEQIMQAMRTMQGADVRVVPRPVPDTSTRRNQR